MRPERSDKEAHYGSLFKNVFLGKPLPITKPECSTERGHKQIGWRPCPLPPGGTGFYSFNSLHSDGNAPPCDVHIKYTQCIDNCQPLFAIINHFFQLLTIINHLLSINLCAPPVGLKPTTYPYITRSLYSSELWGVLTLYHRVNHILLESN